MNKYINKRTYVLYIQPGSVERLEGCGTMNENNSFVRE